MNNFLLLSAAMLAEEKPNGLSLLLPSIPEMFWSALVVFVIAIIFSKVILPKFGSVFSERREKIEGNLEKAAKEREEADRLLEKYNEKLDNASSESIEIIEKAKTDAKKIIKKSSDEAAEKANSIINSASATIDLKSREAETKIKKDIGLLAVELAEKIINKELKDDKNKKALVDDFLSEMN